MGAELDGNQVLNFYWIDPIDAAKRFISKPKFAKKLYTQYRRENSTPANEPLVVRIQAWFFKRVKRLTGSALLFFSCSTQINLFLASTGPTTPYTVSATLRFQTFLMIISNHEINA